MNNVEMIFIGYYLWALVFSVEEDLVVPMLVNAYFLPSCKTVIFTLPAVI